MAQTKIGGSKVAAGKLGISVEKYIQNVQSGLKWCSACRSWLQSDCFGKDKSSFDGKNSRCKICQRALHQKRYKPIAIELRKSREFTTKPSRDGDKSQARAKVNYARLRVINYRTHVTYLVSIAVILVAIVYTNMTITKDTMLSMI